MLLNLRLSHHRAHGGTGCLTFRGALELHVRLNPKKRGAGQESHR
jgi:hypothetical protein